MADKIKAIQPMITVGGRSEKPCYSITYYDTADKQWHIGFSSFDLANVKKWLKEEFEVVAPTAEVEEVRHGEWVLTRQSNGVRVHKCSLCGRPIYTINEDLNDYAPYCHCGARMDGGKAE